MIAVGTASNEKRGSGGGDKVRRMTAEAISAEKKINTLGPCLFSVQ